jgi:hypothetical membrane protein
MGSIVNSRKTNYSYWSGPLLWILSIQYYVIQLIVALDWRLPYSLKHNTISDLGNTACRTYNDSFVCSPLHNLMNGSFVLLGLTMTVGSLLIQSSLTKTKRQKIGIRFMILAGIGTILVGLLPENTVASLHILGAALPFIFGNLAIILLGIELPLSKPLKYYSIISGIVALLAVILFITHFYLGIGRGGMERIVAYPQSVWMIIIGFYLIYSGVLKRRQHKP